MGHFSCIFYMRRDIFFFSLRNNQQLTATVEPFLPMPPALITLKKYDKAHELHTIVANAMKFQY